MFQEFQSLYGSPETLVVLWRLVWTLIATVHWRLGRKNRMLGKENSQENKLNEYFRRRCSNYERFLCDRVWECALCAKQAGKVETLELATVTKVEALRRR